MPMLRVIWCKLPLRVTGTVRKVMYDDTDVVKKGMSWLRWTTAISSWLTSVLKMN